MEGQIPVLLYVGLISAIHPYQHSKEKNKKEHEGKHRIYAYSGDRLERISDHGWLIWVVDASRISMPSLCR